MYVAQSCCGRSSVWLFFVATVHVGAWRRKIKHSSRTTAFLPHTASPDPENTNMLLVMEGNTVAQWLRCCATNWKVAGSIPAGVIGIFYWHKTLPIALWPWGRLSLQQKWVPGAFSGGKGSQCVRLTTLPPSSAVVMKSGNLNFLEPSRPPQACNGNDLNYLLVMEILK